MPSFCSVKEGISICLSQGWFFWSHLCFAAHAPHVIYYAISEHPQIFGEDFWGMHCEKDFVKITDCSKNEKLSIDIIVTLSYPNPSADGFVPRKLTLPHWGHFKEAIGSQIKMAASGWGRKKRLQEEEAEPDFLAQPGAAILDHQNHMRSKVAACKTWQNR